MKVNEDTYGQSDRLVWTLWARQSPLRQRWGSENRHNRVVKHWSRDEVQNPLEQRREESLQTWEIHCDGFWMMMKYKEILEHILLWYSDKEYLKDNPLSLDIHSKKQHIHCSNTELVSLDFRRHLIVNHHHKGISVIDIEKWNLHIHHLDIYQSFFNIQQYKTGVSFGQVLSSAQSSLS